MPFNIVIQEVGCSFLNLAINGTLSSTVIIESFFAITESLWNCGLFETTCDFFRNYGLSREGKPFFIDLGDFTDDFVRASYLIKSKYWEKRKDYAALDLCAKRIFDEMAKENLTPSKLSSCWATEHSELVGCADSR